MSRHALVDQHHVGAGDRLVVEPRLAVVLGKTPEAGAKALQRLEQRHLLQIRPDHVDMIAVMKRVDRAALERLQERALIAYHGNNIPDGRMERATGLEPLAAFSRKTARANAKTYAELNL